MNLTRRILEGINEVELDITPEFRKPGGVGYVLPDDLRERVETVVWMDVRHDSAAPIDHNNRLIIRAKKPDFLHQAAPERGKLMGFLIDSDLVYWWSDHNHAYLVWPKAGQSSQEFRNGLRKLFKALGVHP